MNWEGGAKVVTAAVAVAAFAFGIYEFLQVRAVEAARPYLERKLAWCEEAVETASRIANAKSPAADDRERFEQLFSGVMGLIEKESIKNAMIGFRSSMADEETAAVLRNKSLALAHACRKELSAEWSPLWSQGGNAADGD